jgi:excisionase family DNA binding protein
MSAPNPLPPVLVTTAPAARLAGVSEESLRRWAARGKIRVYRGPGGRRLFDADELRLLAPRATTVDTSPRPLS